MTKYLDFIKQQFYFPNEAFTLKDNELHFNGVPLMDIIERHGTPLKLTYLPKIGQQINKARELFNNAIKEKDYQGNYIYCYCTKSSHFHFVVEEALKHKVQLETSSAYDMAIVKKLYEKGKIAKDITVVCNGYKRPLYTEYISNLINEDWTNVIPVLDNLNEIEHYREMVTKPCQVGMRLAVDEDPTFGFYTSRLGIRYKDVVDHYKEKIENDDRFTLKLLHFFVNTGIRDTPYYWNEFTRFIEKYCELKKICPTLDTIDIGGGFPIQTSLLFEFDYQEVVNLMVENIQRICGDHGVPTPHILSEFGSFTVGESGAVLYSILDRKLQNDKELWYMIDGSFITNLPDTWALNQRFILLAINNWNKELQKVNLGGLTCDSMDYYNSEAHHAEIYLPANTDNQTQYIGYFHCGAYQESIGGYGGIQHCLVPSPKHLVLDRDEDGNLTEWVFSEEQKEEDVIRILGY